MRSFFLLARVGAFVTDVTGVGAPARGAEDRSAAPGALEIERFLALLRQLDRPRPRLEILGRARLGVGKGNLERGRDARPVALAHRFTGAGTGLALDDGTSVASHQALSFFNSRRSRRTASSASRAGVQRQPVRDSPSVEWL